MSFTKPVQYYQNQEPWRMRIYSNHNDAHQTMASSGSGPTLAADVVATLKDPSVDPWDLARLAMNTGCRTYASGTGWGFFKEVFKAYNFKRLVQSRDIEELRKCLDAGGLVVCSMSGGYWFRVENYLLAWQYDNAYVHCITAHRSQKTKQPIDDFVRESRMYFCFYPDDYEEPDDSAKGNE